MRADTHALAQNKQQIYLYASWRRQQREREKNKAKGKGRTSVKPKKVNMRGGVTSCACVCVCVRGGRATDALAAKAPKRAQRRKHAKPQKKNRRRKWLPASATRPLPPTGISPLCPSLARLYMSVDTAKSFTPRRPHWISRRLTASRLCVSSTSESGSRTVSVGLSSYVTVRRRCGTPDR